MAKRNVIVEPTNYELVSSIVLWASCVNARSRVNLRQYCVGGPELSDAVDALHRRSLEQMMKGFPQVRGESDIDIVERHREEASTTGDTCQCDLCNRVAALLAEKEQPHD